MKVVSPLSRLLTTIRCITIIVAGYTSGEIYAMTTMVTTAVMADTLDARRSILQDKLEQVANAPSNNHYPIPMVIETQYDAGAGATQLVLISTIPYTTFAGFFSQDKWCEALILQIHIKACIQEYKQGLDIYLGSNNYAEPEDAFKFEYKFTELTIEKDYLYIAMVAHDGPLFSKDYRISLEIIPTANGKSLINFELRAYFGFFTRAAIQAYLLTTGRSKVGFSILTTDKLGHPIFQQGTKGLLERNAMRYILALLAYLEINPAIETSQKRDIQWLDKSLRRWHRYTEEFREQLYEIDLEDYLSQKRAEYQNQLDLFNGVEKEEWPDD